MNHTFTLDFLSKYRSQLMINSKNKISFSTKVSILSFVLCCGVVSQHVKWTCRDIEWLNALQSFWFFIVETCVPFFFMISGYLFFRTYQSCRWREKLWSRAKSLLVPYLLWNVFYAVVMLSLQKLGAITNMQSINGIYEGVISCVNSEFSPLWFVKYLMVFACISPLMYFVLRNMFLGAMTILVLLLINVYNYYSGNMQVPLNVNANNWIMFIYQYVFFAIGAYGALCFKQQIEFPSNMKSKVGICVLLLLITFYFGYITHFGDVITNHTFRWLWCISLWFTCDLLPEIKVRSWMKYSFFIYYAHMIFVMCFQGTTSIIYMETAGLKPFLQISEYLWLPVLLIYILIKTGDILKSRIPRFWGLITGSRG